MNPTYDKLLNNVIKYYEKCLEENRNTMFNQYEIAAYEKLINKLKRIKNEF